jgi:DNA helicase-2/ATP-dependent DNA helicase PcrA
VSPDGTAAAAARILDKLNPAQREAAEAVRGPVAILAGAGTGKTTTITHRIAWQVASRAFPSNAILAVTYTQKAAGELRERLSVLEVEGVEARTFHSAALWMLGGLYERSTGRALPDVLDHKGRLLNPLANALPAPHRFLPRRELAGEIEWAKNRMIAPDAYLAAIEAEGHEPPIPAELMDRLYRDYDRRVQRAGVLDFEDMLALAIRLFDEHPDAAAAVRDRFAAFTVDEFQDVNPLQAALLDRWLGGRDELCVVGDDYQTIFAFTGASPSHLLSFPERYPTAHVVRLEENYRSTPQVLALANRLAPRLGGFRKELRATRPDGPEPLAERFSSQEAEVAWIVRQAADVHEQGVPWEGVAILLRVNARSEPFEEAFASAGIPYQVKTGAFLQRPAARAVLARLRRAGDGDAVGTIESVTDALGYDPNATPDAEEEVTRQSDLGRLRSMAAEYAAAHAGDASVAGFVAELPRRFSVEESGRGVQLLTYHRAKGLEFDVVFLPRLLEGELPYKSGRSEADPQEERRLFYVGLTRAKHWLAITWPTDTRARVSGFVAEATGVSERPAAASPPKRQAIVVPAVAGPLFDRLRAWRRERAGADGVPPYVVFHDKTLVAIAEARPRSAAALLEIDGVGPAKIERYGDEVLEVVASDAAAASSQSTT